MSHEITNNDKQQGLTQAWHGLTEVLPVISLITCWLSQWDVKLSALYRKVDAAGILTEQETGFTELACTDKSDVIVSKEPINPKTFLAVVVEAMAQIPGAIVASVGSLCNRARIFVTLAVPEMPSFLAAGREWKPYLNFLSSHDKSCEFTVVASIICTVCNNTFSANLQDTDGDTLRIGIKHRPGMAARLANVPAIVGAYYATVEHFRKVMDKLATMPATGKEARAFFAGMLTEGLDMDDNAMAAGLSGVRRNQVRRMLELFVSGKGNDGNGWDDVFSAVTDYFTHESAGGTDDPMRQEASSEFKTGLTMKARAFALMQDDKAIVAVMERGQKLLDNTEE